jgi:hypothetical protein
LSRCFRARLAPDTMVFLIFTDTWRSGGQSQLICVGTLDLASVSAIVRRVSDSVRQRRPIFSPIVRRKVPWIARSPHFDCAFATFRLRAATAIRSFRRPGAGGAAPPIARACARISHAFVPASVFFPWRA